MAPEKVVKLLPAMKSVAPLAITTEPSPPRMSSLSPATVSLKFTSTMPGLAILNTLLGENEFAAASARVPEVTRVMPE